MYCIGITGGSAGGKTTFVNQLKQKFTNEQVVFISQDDYYNVNDHLTMEERVVINYDHPNAIDFELLNEHISSLKKEKEINKPIYDFATHNRIAETEIIKPKKVLILEGILILNDSKLTSNLEYTIFVDAPATSRLQRRTVRDVKERGRTKESVLDQWNATIHPMHNQFVEPHKTTVNLVIDGTQPFDNALVKVSNLISEQLI